MIHGRRDKPQTRTAEESDLYGHWRHLLFWQRGERRKVKRRTHKWSRRQGKDEIWSELSDWLPDD